MTVLNSGNNFPPEKPNLIDRLISYSLVNIAILPAIWSFMYVLNQTTIVGRNNIKGLKPPWMLMSNHLTLLDDLFIGPLLFGPGTFKGYNHLPYHAPEERNFYKNRFAAWFMRRVKSIPVVRGKGIHQEGVERLIVALREGGLLQIFPEGTRTRTGKIGKPKSGIGRIVYESGAPVVPMYHEGLELVLPIGSGIPAIGKRIHIAVGEPIYFKKELSRENNPQTWRGISSRIMDAIYEQKYVVEKRLGAKSV